VAVQVTVPHRIISVVEVETFEQLWGELDNTTLDGIPPNGTEGILGVDLGGAARDR